VHRGSLGLALASFWGVSWRGGGGCEGVGRVVSVPWLGAGGGCGKSVRAIRPEERQCWASVGVVRPNQVKRLALLELRVAYIYN
jgi:hypothetical protein